MSVPLPSPPEPIAAYRAAAGAGDVAAAGDADAWARAVDAVPGAPPLLIDAGEWRGVEAGVSQRAELLERVLADLYGPARLVSDGRLPAAAVAGSPSFLRSMVGVVPPGGRWLRAVAFDLVRDPGGGWRVVRDLLATAEGLGAALGNRLGTRSLPGDPLAHMGVERHAPFFGAFREGLAGACRRVEPRIGVLTPGRGDAGYEGHALLARYLGFPLVEGADLAALDGRAYLRTVEGLKRVDALWRWAPARRLDPLAFDAGAGGGVPALVDAYAGGELVLANAPGAGAVATPATMAFLPRLAEAVLGEALLLPNVATWWCGGEAARPEVLARLDELEVAPAFEAGLHGDRDAPPAGMARRPQDYIGRERLGRSTMPVAEDGALTPKPFTLRAFAARGGDGGWRVLPGGLVALEGGGTADAWVLGGRRSAAASLLPTGVRVRRRAGTLPSRAADDLFWLGRYLERGEARLAAEAALAGAEGDAAARLGAVVAELGGDPDAEARRVAERVRERLDEDMLALIGDSGGSHGRYAALAGMAARMARGDAWTFHDLGRRIERGLAAARAVRALGLGESGEDSLRALLELTGAQVAYRGRYGAAVARAAVLDLAVLDPGNPGGAAFQAARIDRHLAARATLAGDGIPEPAQRAAAELAALVATAGAVDPGLVAEVERRLRALSDLVARRYFLQGAEPLRGAAMVLG